MLDIVKLSLWNTGSATADVQIFEEIRKHALISLPAKVLLSISMPSDLYTEWKTEIIKQIAYYCKYTYIQSNIPITVPFVILKGTSAALYYPCPELRTMGDIDIITRREDYGLACKQFLDNNYRETTGVFDEKRGRHRTFVKDGISIEVHAFFASMNDLDKARYFDDLVIENINGSHVLPDLINGLVLLEHINQHMEEGLGLRQVIDWMMFVDRCLGIDDWNDFRKYAEKVGLDTLAITVTRMCEMYLGLKEHKWCELADEKLCSDLMDYVMKCGNFGNKLTYDQKISISRLFALKHPINLLKSLQTKGVANWAAAKNPLLKPFAWLWQSVQYVQKSPGVMNNYSEADRLDKMFDALGVKRNKNGLVYYENGEYYKRNT